MELKDAFEVDYPVETVWAVLTDVERIAPCLPGARLTGADGDEYKGLVKVKVGPITSQYNGKASFTERDDDAHRLLMSASGRDSRGAGNASAAISVQLEAVGDSATRVSVHTDLTITGKVAQFGRGVLADVSRKLMGQFAGNLAELIAEDADRDAAADTPADDTAASEEPAAASSGVEASQAAVEPGDVGEGDKAADAADDDVEAVDLLEVAGAPVLKRLVPAVIALVVVVIIVIVAVSA